MSEENMTSAAFWDAHKTCGELSYEECDDRFQNLHVDLASKQNEIDSLQAKIDALMLEYCPNEMTDEQVATWELNQRTVKEK